MPTRCNLAVDDYMPGSNIAELHKLVKEIPGIKVNLFVAVDSRILPGNNLLTANPEWLARTSALPPENFEIALHGVEHTLAGEPEFKHLDYATAKAKLLFGFKVLADTGLSFVRGFRPPQWQLSKEAVRAINDLELDFLTDAPLYHSLHKQQVQVPRFYSNVDIAEGWEKLYSPKTPYYKFLPDIKKVFFARGHSVSQCANNLTPKNIARLKRWVSELDADWTFMSTYARSLRG